MESEKIIYHHKPIEELTFTDDGMFQAVLHEPDICAELIERLLHIRVHHVDYPRTADPSETSTWQAHPLLPKYDRYGLSDERRKLYKTER